MKLSQKEEQLINYIWQLEKAYMKELMEAYPDPKPAVTTLATLLKRLTVKGAISFDLHGNSRQYYALIKKEVYSSSYLKNMIKTFFQDSTSRFASFFANNSDLNKEELHELRNMIDDKLKTLEK